MKILVVGSGGREHAVVWALSNSQRAAQLFCSPGNPGISRIARCLPAGSGSPEDFAALAESVGAVLTFVGPEAPLVAGIADCFASRGLKLVGPTRAAARLEGSKVFAKQFMESHSIPTARFSICKSPQAAREALAADHRFPIVVKADGLAAGKGVRVCQNQEEFESAIRDIMVDKIFGDAGSEVLLEECLIGRENSLMLFTDGRDYRMLAAAQDYKRAFDGDVGPNTGGMGSFSTPGLLDDATLSAIQLKIIEPALEGMSADGAPFSGTLYVGLMLTSDGPKVIEFNARLGDPETQSILTRLESDLVDVSEAIVEGRVGELRLDWSTDSTVCVVAASAGYPVRFEKGKAVQGLGEAEAVDGVVVFQAGTVSGEKGQVLTSGGRVLGITARADCLANARSRAYEAIGKIHFEGMHFRRDIAAL